MHKNFFYSYEHGQLNEYIMGMFILYIIQLCFMSVKFGDKKNILINEQVEITVSVSKFFEHSTFNIHKLYEVINEKYDGEIYSLLKYI